MLFRRLNRAAKTRLLERDPVAYEMYVTERRQLAARMRQLRAEAKARRHVNPTPWPRVGVELLGGVVRPAGGARMVDR